MLSTCPPLHAPPKRLQGRGCPGAPQALRARSARGSRGSAATLRPQWHEGGGAGLDTTCGIHQRRHQPGCGARGRCRSPNPCSSVPLGAASAASGAGRGMGGSSVPQHLGGSSRRGGTQGAFCQSPSWLQPAPTIVTSSLRVRHRWMRPPIEDALGWSWAPGKSQNLLQSELERVRGRACSNACPQPSAQPRAPCSHVQRARHNAAAPRAPLPVLPTRRGAQKAAAPGWPSLEP